MSAPRFQLLAGLAALALVAAPGQPGASPAAQQITPDQMRGAAYLALEQGGPQVAYRFSQALLDRDPTDRDALFIQSRAARDMGQYDQAKASARSAWKLAQDDHDKYTSAMLMAQALSSNGQRTMAQLWLRRAVEHAPSEALERRAINDFKYVRARNPWLTRISFAVTPDSNINNGSSSRSSFLAVRNWIGPPVEVQLDNTLVALSGIEYSWGFATRYRWLETETRAHDVTFAADLRTYTLSPEAKNLAPDAEGDDFAFGSYMLGYGHRGINFDRRGEYRIAANAGQIWYGGEEYARFVRFNTSQSYKLERGRQINARIAGERQHGITTSDSDTIRADLSYSFRLNSGAAVWTNLTGAVADSSSASDEFTELALRGQITFAKPFLGATAQLGLWARMRDYDYSIHSFDGRHDDRIQADFTLIFDQIDYHGFNPTMRISASRTNSNIGLYQAERFGVNFGIQSAF